MLVGRFCNTGLFTKATLLSLSLALLKSCAELKDGTMSFNNCLNNSNTMFHCHCCNVFTCTTLFTYSFVQEWAGMHLSHLEWLWGRMWGWESFRNQKGIPHYNKDTYMYFCCTCNRVRNKIWCRILQGKKNWSDKINIYDSILSLCYKWKTLDLPRFSFYFRIKLSSIRAHDRESL